MPRSVLHATFLLFAMLARPAAGQCLDWGLDFAPPVGGIAGTVHALAAFDDGAGPALYVGGNFSHAGGQPIADLARWDGAGWSAVGGEITGYVNALAAFDDGSGPALYIGGNFSAAGGVPAGHIARWTGAAWEAVGSSGMNGQIHTLAVHDDGSGSALYAGGNFTTADGAPAPGLARWDGLSWSAVGQFDGSVRALLSADIGNGRQLYAGGSFSSVGGTPAANIAALASGVWSPLAGGLLGSVHALAEFGGRVVAGGDFSHAGGGNLARNGVAAWNGSSWLPLGSAFSNGVNGDVRALAVHHDGFGEALYVAGPFFSAHGAPAARHIAKWNGSAWSAVGAGVADGTAQPVANALCSGDLGQGAGLYLGGRFRTAGGADSAGIARWGAECYGPVFAAHPADTIARFPDGSVDLSARVYGTPPLSLRWRHDGQWLSDDGRLEGTATERLRINDWTINDAGLYEMVAFNEHGMAFSEPAQLTVPAPGGRPPVSALRIALTGDPLPDKLPGVLKQIYRPYSADGTLAASAAVQSGITDVPLIVRWTGGVLDALPTVGTQAPGTADGVVYTGVGEPAPNPLGGVAFAGALAGPGVHPPSNGTGIWYSDLSRTDLVVRDGDVAPGTGGAFFTEIYSNAAGGGMSPEGHVAFTGIITSQNEPTGLWSWRRGSGTSLLAITGMNAPGDPGRFAWFQEPASVLPGGRVVFSGGLDTVTFPGAGADVGLWVGVPGDLAAVAVAGRQAPLQPPGALVSYVGQPVANRQGALLYRARVLPPGESQREVLYTWQDGSHGLVPLPDPLPAGLESLVVNTAQALADDGSLAFVGSLLSPPPDGPHGGLFAIHDGSFVTVAMLTGAATGALDGYVFDGWTQPEGPIISMGGAGQLVFSINTRPIDSSALHSGVFGWTPSVGVFPIVVPGGPMDVGPDDVRTVREAWAVGPRALWPDGRVPLYVHFTDDSRGMFLGSFADALGAYHPCPVVLVPPADTEPSAGADAVLTVRAAGEPTLAYQWRRDGTPLSDGDGIEGTATASLTIRAVGLSDVGSYDVVVSNGCGSTTSPAATLTVPCAADLSGDGNLTVADFTAFRGAYLAGDLLADFTGDGQLTVADFSAFRLAYLAGCP